jgi:hypothetical protein
MSESGTILLMAFLYSEKLSGRPAEKVGAHFVHSIHFEKILCVGKKKKRLRMQLQVCGIPQCCLLGVSFPGPLGLKG